MRHGGVFQRGRFLVAACIISTIIPCANALADDPVYYEEGWGVSSTADPRRPGENRCVLLSPDVNGSDRFWMSNNGSPRLEPNGAAHFGLVLRDTLENLYGESYPEKLGGVRIFVPGEGFWEAQGSWKSREPGGTAQFHVNVSVEEFLTIFEKGGKIVFTLPLPEPENRFSLTAAGVAVSKYRECLAGGKV